MADQAASPRMQSLIAASVFLIALAFLTLEGLTFPLSLELRRTIAWMTLAAAALPWRGQGRSGGRRVAELACLAATLILVARAPSVPVALAAYALAVSMISARLESIGSAFLIPRGLSQACMTYLAVRFAVDLLPQLESFANRAAGLAGEYASRVGAGKATPSFSALGGQATLLGAIYLLWRWRFAGVVARLAVAVALPVAWFFATAAVPHDTAGGPLAAFGRGSAHGFAWIALAVGIDAVINLRWGIVGRPLPSVSRRSPIAACGAMMLVGACLVGTSLLGPAIGRKIVVHNRGGLDWDRPVFGRFGVFSGGMFGLLPVYCKAEGYDFDVIDKDAIEPGDLSGSQILVLINSPKAWPAPERRAVLDFVDRGGNLLVLGDHTDVFGLQRGFNALIDAFGIQLRFDSAYNAREHWRGCLAASPDAVAWGWDGDNPSVAIGASLECGGSARPLLVGRYGFSDAGVRENYVGSFLGNYQYDAGERLGDVTLVATASYGRGRVVVWGDTTPFQGGLSHSYQRVVGPLLSWMSRPSAWTERPPTRTVAAVALLGIICWLWAARIPSSQACSVPIGLLIGLLIPWLLSLKQIDAHVSVAADTVIVDRSHFPAIGHYAARVNPVSPLYTSFLRSGFRVAEIEDWEPASFAGVRAIAFVAPQRSFSTSEVGDLLEFERAGGVVLLSVGQPDAEGSRAILEAHELSLSPRPLGTIMAADRNASRRVQEEQPRFFEAWPITTGSNGDPGLLQGVEVIYRHGEDVVALFRRVGRGGLLLIGDSRFFSDMNVEDVSTHWPGNMALIHDLFQRYLGATPDAVSPLFRSPDKPQ